MLLLLLPFFFLRPSSQKGEDGSSSKNVNTLRAREPQQPPNFQTCSPHSISIRTPLPDTLRVGVRQDLICLAQVRIKNSARWPYLVGESSSSLPPPPPYINSRCRSGKPHLSRNRTHAFKTGENRRCVCACGARSGAKREDKRGEKERENFATFVLVENSVPNVFLSAVLIRSLLLVFFFHDTRFCVTCRRCIIPPSL